MATKKEMIAKVKRLEMLKENVRAKTQQKQNKQISLLESAVKVKPGKFSLEKLINDVTAYNDLMETSYSVKKDMIIVDNKNNHGREGRLKLAHYLKECGYGVQGIRPQAYLKSNISPELFNNKKFGFAPLLEGELERAELILSAQGIADKLRTMAEDLSKIQSDSLMPLSDALKVAFGYETAERFNEQAKQVIDTSLETIVGAKDQLAKQISELTDTFEDNTEEPMGPSDMEMDTNIGSEPDMDLDDETGGSDLDGDNDLDDLEGDPAGAGDDEPLGRGMKDDEDGEEDQLDLEGGPDSEDEALNETYRKRGKALLAKVNALKEAKKSKKPDFADIDGDGDKKEPMSKAAKDKKEENKGGSKSSKKPKKGEIPPQLRKHVKGKE